VRDAARRGAERIANIPRVKRLALPTVPMVPLPDGCGRVIIMKRRRLAAAVASLSLACTSAPPDGAPPAAMPWGTPPPNVTVDPEVKALQPVLVAGMQTVVEFFERGTDVGDGIHDFSLHVSPDRASFSASLPAAWGMGETPCWMVAAGVADALYVISPRAWASESCEHDGSDALHVQQIITHELVHVYHGQHNPTRDFTGADEIGWFVEGLAVYASGQLEQSHAADARAAIDLGVAPIHLADAWTGRYRDGVCGSLVQCIDRTAGRRTLRRLLHASGQPELLGELGCSERELLDRWRQWVLAQPR
jgi:hypothetical protein